MSSNPPPAGASKKDRLGNKCQYYFDRFQRFMRFVHLFMGGEAFLIIAVVLITKPHPSSLFFIIPISILGLSLITYVATAIYFFVPYCRAAVEEMRRRKQGLPIDTAEPGPWLTDS